MAIVAHNSQKHVITLWVTPRGVGVCVQRVCALQWCVYMS